MSYLSDLLGKSYKEGMTEEEISTALQSMMGKEDSEVTRLKTALSKANSEAADYKKQLRAKQSDDEAAEAARKEEFDKIMQENSELKRSIALSEKKAKLLSMGYDEKLADETATAMIDGDMDKVLSNQSIYLEAQKKSIAATTMRNTPRPATGAENVNTVLDYDTKINEAQSHGDYATIAYYTRLREESKKSTE